MKHLRILIGSAVLLAGLALGRSAGAQTEGTNYSPGLAVGAQAPAFTLPGQDGQEHTLAEFLKKGTVALVFYRSADW